MEPLCAQWLSQARGAFAHGRKNEGCRIVGILRRCERSSDCADAPACRQQVRALVQGAFAQPCQTRMTVSQ